MAIERWEMLLSSRADCYLLKIRGPQSDVDKIVAAHPTVCQEVQEINDDVFQWTIFVVDAPLPVRLAIQNLIMTMTAESGPARASAELGEMMEGLSGALENLTNLTDDERNFVMQKIARTEKNAGSTIEPPPKLEPPPIVAPPSAPKPPPASLPPSVPPAPAPPAKPTGPVPPKPGMPIPPAKAPGPVSPIPRMPGAPPPLPPLKPSMPGSPPPPTTDRPLPRVNPMPIPQVAKQGLPPLPPKQGGGPVPPIVRPAQPPASAGIVGKPPLPPVPPIVRPVQPPPPPPVAKPPAAPPPPPVLGPPSPPAPPSPPLPPREEPRPAPPPLETPMEAPLITPDPLAEKNPPPTDYPEREGAGRVIDLGIPGGGAPAAKIPNIISRPEPPDITRSPAVEPPGPQIIPRDTPKAQGIEPLSFVPPPTAKPVMTPFGPSLPADPSALPSEMVAMRPSPPPSSPPEAGAAKGEELPLRFTIFFPSGGESLRDRFTAMLTDVAQKKARKPLQFQVIGSVPTTVTMEHSTEWIWTAKANGADCFFVLLPPDVLPDYMEGLTAEAQTAGMRCFLVPQNEISSKLLYMDFMLELMMIKRKVKWG